MSGMILTEFDRFLAALSPGLREECEEKLTPTGLPADHPIFGALADIFGRHQGDDAAGTAEAAPDFLQEAQLHSTISKQILEQFSGLPEKLKAAIEAKLAPLQDVARPLVVLGAVAERLDRQIQDLAVLFPPNPPPTMGRWGRAAWRFARIARSARDVISHGAAWMVAGSVSLAAAAVVTVLVLYFGALHLQRHYEDMYKRRISTLETTSVQDAVTLSRLAEAGITIELRRPAQGDGYFLLLKGARKAAQPVNSPDGLAVQVWH